MKEITNRTELAEAVNIRRLPVIRFNWEEPLGSYAPNSHRGERVNILWTSRDGSTFPSICEVDFFEDTNEFTIMQHGACIAARFCYEDADDMIEAARAPIVKEGDEVVIVKQFPSKRIAHFFLAVVGKINCRASDCGKIF